ncbi:MAG: hypothetical protein ACYTEW_21550, partial [Planctomycetota bacterium]
FLWAHFSIVVYNNFSAILSLLRPIPSDLRHAQDKIVTFIRNANCYGLPIIPYQGFSVQSRQTKRRAGAGPVLSALLVRKIYTGSRPRSKAPTFVIELSRRRLEMGAGVAS